MAAADVAAADVAAADLAAVTAPWLPLLQVCCVPVSVSVCRCLCVCAYSCGLRLGLYLRPLLCLPESPPRLRQLSLRLPGGRRRSFSCFPLFSCFFGLGMKVC